MQIHLQKDAFLRQLFPGLAEADWQDDARLAQYIRNAYSKGGYTPEVSVEGDVIRIEVDEAEAASTRQAYAQVVKLAERGQYAQARAILQPILEKGTQNADLYRIYGQILAEEGEAASAMDYLIEALRWNPKLTDALILMGNLYAEKEGDMDTAQLFYDRVMELDAGNYLALNNIGGVWAKTGQLDKAISFFERSLQAQPDFPNALYGLALAHYKNGAYRESFEQCLSAMRGAKMKGSSAHFLKLFLELMQESATAYTEAVAASDVYQELRRKLEKETGKDIVVRAEEQIPTAAKLEVGEYKQRPEHRVLYKPGHPAVAHLIMHELIHLELITEARAIQENQLFTTSHKEAQQFRSRAGAARKRLAKAGFDEARIAGFMDMLFNGINSQLYNAPIDLFIEQRLYARYPALRPVQFLSLLRLNREAIQGANTESAKAYSPRFVRDANIVLSFTQLFLFRELFGLDLASEIKEPRLHKKAKKLYADFLKMRDDKEPGEEYDLIEWWGEDLELQGLYTLVRESPLPAAAAEPANDEQGLTPEALMDALEQDPYGINSKDIAEEEAMQQFIDAQRSSGLNMAVVMYMVDALRHFKGRPKKEAKDAGFEIAELGRSGINPERGERYSLSSIPGVDFTGWKLLAYMYVSWSIFEPQLVGELQLDFEEEYALAQQLHQKGML